MRRRSIIKLFGFTSGITGLVILAGVFLPIVDYVSFANEKYPTLLSPLVEENSETGSVNLDYTLASNWFTGVSRDAFTTPNISYFSLSVPKLGINNATVAVGGDDLSKSLIQYPGTALPGKKGNAVIFGHSILPIFYNPKDYMAIFSTLHTLKKGDEIQVSYDGVFYKYQVEEMYEVLPTDLKVLSQEGSDSYITLITCTPPGDPRKPKRLIVKARVVPFNQASGQATTNLQ